MDKSIILEYLLRVPIVLFSLTVHEVAHGYAAYKMGDPTAKNLGRLSLNPLKHLDPLGTLCMILFRFGWAKPVPISTRYFKKPKLGMAISSLAGPLSNLLMAFLAFVISAYLLRFGSYGGFFDTYTTGGRILYMLYLFFDTFYWMNITFAIFNLIPVPPLDGSRILYVVLPDKLYFGIMRYEQFIYLGLMACLFFGLLDGILTNIIWLFTVIFTFVVQFFPFL